MSIFSMAVGIEHIGICGDAAAADDADINVHCIGLLRCPLWIWSS